MLGNTPLLTFNLEKNYLELHTNKWFPFVLRDEQTLERVRIFLKNRLPVTSRQDYREICADAGIHPEDTAEWQRRTHCLSVDDDFWVRPIGSDIRHEQIDPRVHSK